MFMWAFLNRNFVLGFNSKTTKMFFPQTILGQFWDKAVSPDCKGVNNVTLTLMSLWTHYNHIMKGV